MTHQPAPSFPDSLRVVSKRCYIIGTPVQRTAVSAHFQALANELVRRGHEAVIVAPPAECEPDPKNTSFHVHSWPSPRPTRFPDAIFLWRLIRKYRPDCLIANFAPVNWMCLVGWLTNVPCRIAWYHTLSTQNALDSQLSPGRQRFLQMRKAFVYRRATHLATNSTAALEDAYATFGVQREKCKVWRNSLPDPMAGASLATDHRPPAVASATLPRESLVVCAGRFDRSKGQDVLIDALGRCRDKLSPAKIEFLGTGPLVDPLRARAAQSGLAESCVFRGAVSHEEVLQRMSRARLTVVPSRSEAFGLVNIESMAVGTPVLASSVDGIRDIVRDGIDGFLVPVNDPAALAERLVKLLGDPVLCQQLGKNARERFLSCYEQSRVVAAQADWLERITDPQKHNPTRSWVSST
jgi:glycosyltransferase involved in cell wall biosynthesis